jgi:hypothetical protein
MERSIVKNITSTGEDDICSKFLRDHGNVGNNAIDDLFLQFIYLYGKFDDDCLREEVWNHRRELLEPVDYFILDETIQVEKGFYFSAIEKLPQLMLPYFDVPIYNSIYKNGERARTHFSNVNVFPGLFSAASAVQTKYDYCILTIQNLGIQVGYAKFTNVYIDVVQGAEILL